LVAKETRNSHGRKKKLIKFKKQGLSPKKKKKKLKVTQLTANSSAVTVPQNFISSGPRSGAV
jgi:hypothetical protein